MMNPRKVFWMLSPLLGALVLVAGVKLWGHSKYGAIDSIQLLETGAMIFNGKAIAQFSDQEAIYTHSAEIGKQLHRFFRNHAKGKSAAVQVHSQTSTGWNNRLVHVVYGLVEFGLTSWYSFSYQVDDEPAVLPEIGLYRTARQLTAEFLPEDEMEGVAYLPYLYLEPEKIELTPGNHCLDQGLCVVVIGGGETPLNEVREKLRRFMGQNAQVGFEQRMLTKKPTPEELGFDLPQGDWDHLSLCEDGRVMLNDVQAGNFPLVFEDYLDLRQTEQSILSAFRQFDKCPALHISVEGECATLWVHVVLGTVFSNRFHDSKQWPTVRYQVDDDPPVPITRRLYFTARAISCWPREDGSFGLRLNGPFQEFHGGTNTDQGMCATLQIYQPDSLPEVRARTKEFFGPYAEYGVTQYIQAVIPSAEPTAPTHSTQ